MHLVCVNNNNRYGLMPIPITSQNGLPYIKFSLGKDKDSTDVKLLGMTLLYDTGAALNTGFLPYYDLIQQRNPEILSKYENFDGSNPFDLIKLCGAIIDHSEYDGSKHDILSATIEYYTPYTYSNWKRFKLTLSLGADM